MKEKEPSDSIAPITKAFSPYGQKCPNGNITASSIGGGEKEPLEPYLEDDPAPIEEEPEPKDITNGHANGDGHRLEAEEVHRQNQSYEQAGPLRAWKRRMASCARELLKTDPEFHKPHLSEEDLIGPLVADLRLSFQYKPEYFPPSDLSETEITEELEVVAGWAIGEFLKQRAAEREEEDSKPEPLKMLDLGALYNLVDEWDRQPWVWQGILPRSSLSLIVGKSETGKSTLIYRLIYAIVRGADFFGRACEKGRVLYLAGDPISEVVAGKTFRELGLDSSEGIRVVPGALVGSPTGMKDLRQWVADFRPALVVGDTLAATVAIDVDKYGQSYQVQQPLTQLAREFSPNFLMSHHSQKSAIDTYSVIDAALGSVGVAAVASSRMATRMYRRNGKKFYTFEMSNLRIGQPIEGEHVIDLLDNGLMELGGMWGKKTVEMDSEMILEVLKRQDAPIAERTLWNEIFPKPKWMPFRAALNSLIEKGLVKVEPRAKRGGGRMYRLPGIEALQRDWTEGQ